jgi:hypothetical protein
MIFIMSREEKDLLKQLRSLKALDDVSALQAETIALKKKVTDLEIQRSQKQEEWDRGDRELRHMIGLEKKRQEFEITQAKKEAMVGVREENLAADKARFSEEMKFQRERFEGEVKYLKDMIESVLKRVPDISMEIHKGPSIEVKHSGG